ncbi:tyrosine-type recombinase/integrase [Ectopseudomonas oleovorans]|uniref:tyrosine-type recombinase/integrase n=1 Tax=Ectopseudomonas oleovorans TaxID=301 RepID=UPI0019D2DD09|nr:integrase arm-type DNA-binding domain-containing protein [Pseudomonas oleovorans]MBN7117567.1 integrase [Pseudomonas oleovorans]MBN7131282.1 integrase [Pseudomonas oleovorans]MBN7140716.1 integrase [Pseudomonas oleovorans]
MARPVTPLTDPKCEAAKPREREYKLFDGQGLYLAVKPTGTKVWRFKYNRPDGRAGLATFGNYPALTLKAARARRAAALELLANGQDPMAVAKATKISEANARANTFRAMAAAWHEACARKWSPGHAATVWRRIETYLLPGLGDRPIADLKTRDLLAPLKAVEQRDTLETAGRLRQYMTGIMRLAVQHGQIDTNPAIDLQGSTATRKTEHRPALPLDRLPELLQRLDADTGRPLTRLATQLALLVFIRSSELRFARWGEVDIDRAMWEIPGQREAIEGVKFSSRGAKMSTPHLVPLSRQALAVLDQVRQLTGRFDLVFVGDHHHWKPMSENTINKALRRMGYDTKADICGHGFRTMACSALVESGLWSRDAVERQMSHQERDSVRSAYIHKAEHLQERRLMVQWWADYLDANRQQHVTPYDFAHRGESAANVVPVNFGKVV